MCGDQASQFAAAIQKRRYLAHVVRPSCLSCLVCRCDSRSNCRIAPSTGHVASIYACHVITWQGISTCKGRAYGTACQSGKVRCVPAQLGRVPLERRGCGRGLGTRVRIVRLAAPTVSAAVPSREGLCLEAGGLKFVRRQVSWSIMVPPAGRIPTHASCVVYAEAIRACHKTS
jgi:hypothetical protein